MSYYIIEESRWYNKKEGWHERIQVWFYSVSFIILSKLLELDRETARNRARSSEWFKKKLKVMPLLHVGILFTFLAR